MAIYTLVIGSEKFSCDCFDVNAAIVWANKTLQTMGYDAYKLEWAVQWDSRFYGKRLLVWKNAEDSMNDAGQNAIGELVRNG